MPASSAASLHPIYTYVPTMETSMSLYLSEAPADEVETLNDVGCPLTTLDRPRPFATTRLVSVTLNLNGLPTKPRIVLTGRGYE